MQLSRKSIFNKTFPLVLSELSEALLLLTGVLFMSWEDERYLAAIGMIDAALLCGLAYGFSLTDSFQRFYARYFATNKEGENAQQLLWQSFVQFALVAIVICVLGLSFVFVLSGIYSNELIEICLQSAPWLVAILIVYYLALPFHAFLIGKGHTRLVGWLATAAIVINAVLTGLFLHVWHWEMLPTNAVLFAAFFAESVWLILLFGICCRRGYFVFLAGGAFRGYRIYKVIHRAAVYPGLSLTAFHLGTSVLFVYLSWCCAEQQVAALTLILGFWGVLIAPVNGMADAANNDFSNIYARNKMAVFSVLRFRYLQIAALMGAVVFILLLGLNAVIGSGQQMDWSVLGVVGLLALLTIINKFDFVALLSRLHNNSFAGIKLFFGVAVAISVISFDLFFDLEIILLLIAVLSAQLVVTRWLNLRVKSVWLAPE